MKRDILILDIVQKAFVGKKFIASEFHEGTDRVYDANENEVTDARNLYGKTIMDARFACCGRDGGIVLKFAEFDKSIFFYANDYITVEDYYITVED